MSDDNPRLLDTLIVVGGTLGGLTAGVCDSLFGSGRVAVIAGLLVGVTAMAVMIFWEGRQYRQKWREHRERSLADTAVTASLAARHRPDQPERPAGERLSGDVQEGERMTQDDAVEALKRTMERRQREQRHRWKQLDEDAGFNVSEQIEQAVAEEREVCARIAEAVAEQEIRAKWSDAGIAALKRIAMLIREGYRVPAADTSSPDEPQQAPTACQHDKSFAPFILASYPAQHPWVCRRCGERGVDREAVAPANDYEETIRRFQSPCEGEGKP